MLANNRLQFTFVVVHVVDSTAAFQFALSGCLKWINNSFKLFLCGIVKYAPVYFVIFYLFESSNYSCFGGILLS